MAGRSSELAAQWSFSSERYLDHVRTLASDEWGGRGTGQPGNDLAAEYLADRFREFGLEPAGVDGTYFQPFEAPRGRKLVEQEAMLKISAIERELRLREDWIPHGNSRVLKGIEGDLAFAGYGISAPQYDYDDYANFDATGKVLLILRYEPKAEDESARFGGRTPSLYSTFSSKARAAAERKAAALIVVNPHQRWPEDSSDGAADELMDFPEETRGEAYDVPIVQVKRAVADAILERAGMLSVEELARALDRTRQSLSCDLPGMWAHVRPGVRKNRFAARNVIALHRGDGSTDETIVVGAHYDHLGTKKERGETVIYNGADDNASGTAGLIEMARAFAAQPAPRRNVLLMAFSAEEWGLLGSKHFVNHPTIELSRIKFMLNMDMIGRLDPEKFIIYGSETGVGLRDVAQQASDEVGLPFKAVRDRGMFGRSDHASFHRKGIPILFPFTNLHKDYHKPTDDTEFINADGAVRILELMYRIAREIADMDEGPQFVESTRPSETVADVAPEDTPIPAVALGAASAPASDAAEARLVLAEPSAASQPASQPAATTTVVLPAPSRRSESPAHPTPVPSDADSPRMPRVRFGIAPDYADEGPGMRIETVTPGRAAARAGIKEGDRILQIGSEKVGGVESYMRALGTCSPGDEVDVLIDRNGERLTLKVKLDAPPQDN
jgi:hypothetical protein